MQLKIQKIFILFSILILSGCEKIEHKEINLENNIEYSGTIDGVTIENLTIEEYEEYNNFIFKIKKEENVFCNSQYLKIIFFDEQSNIAHIRDLNLNDINLDLCKVTEFIFNIKFNKNNNFKKVIIMQSDQESIYQIK